MEIQKPSSFGGFRSEGFPTQYPANKTAAEVDVLVAGIILAFVMVGFTFLLILPAWRGLERAKMAIRIFVSLIIGGIIFTTNFGQRWEVAMIESNAPYKAGAPDELRVEVGVNLGLRALNITLVALTPPENRSATLKHEIINYNEEFRWTWDQGRFGFGPYAGLLQRTFRENQRKGLPLPILWVADYFTLDGEGYRFGRFYRTAGWYTHILMWTALTTWMLSVILLHNAVRYGALMTCFTGILQLVACLLWGAIRNPYDLIIPFEDAILEFHYGSDFWATLVNGLICFILGVGILILDYLYPEAVAIFFGIDPLSECDEYHSTPQENDDSNKDIRPFEVGFSGPMADKDQVVLLRRRSGLLGNRPLSRVLQPSGGHAVLPSSLTFSPIADGDEDEESRPPSYKSKTSNDENGDNQGVDNVAYENETEIYDEVHENAI